MNIERDQQYIASTYKRFPVEIVRGHGSEVYDPAGKRYIDMGSGIGVTAFGVADAEWQAAVTEQIGKVQHMSNLYYTAPCAALAELLCQKTGMKKVFFSNSGAEANECAIKLARKYASDRYGADRYTIVTLQSSFHGRTLTTLAATGQDHFHKLFQPLTPGFASIPVGDLAALEEIHARTPVAGVLVECIQGEGGVLPVDPAFLRGLQDWCHKEDALLMVDEVQTGNGRSGELYSYMNFDLAPDVVSTAKGLAGGLPLGATLMSEKVEGVFGYGDHGSTFGGNPVCCAAALSILRRIDDGLLAEVRRKSDFLFSALRELPGVKSVSGMGLMIGIETERPAAEVVAACIEKGLLCLTAKTKVRLLPALNIPDALLREAVEILREACGKTA